MRNIKLIILLCGICFLNNTLTAQEINNPFNPLFIEKVEENSTTLNAFYDKIEASKQAAKVGIAPANPEVSYSYTKNGSLFGEELIVSQKVDFPTVYGKKNKLASLQQKRLEAEYKLYRRNLITEAYNFLSEYAFIKRMVEHNKTRVDRSNEIFRLMGKRFELGDISAIELSKAKMEHAVLSSELLKWKKKLALTKKSLEAYIGEISKDDQLLIEMVNNVAAENYNITQREELEKLWMTQNDDVLRAKFESELSQQNVALKKAEALPSFSVGYRRDRNKTITMNGVAAGISIPLWEKQNTVKQAKAEQVFAESSKFDAETLAKIEFDQHLAETLQNLELFNALNDAIPGKENLDKLKNTLEAGHISILEYYNQLAVFYELENKLEEARVALQNSYIALFKVAI